MVVFRNSGNIPGIDNRMFNRSSRLLNSSSVSMHLHEQSIDDLVSWRGERAFTKLQEITQRHVHHHAHRVHAHRAILTLAASKQSCHLRQEVLQPATRAEWIRDSGSMVVPGSIEA